MIVEQAAAGDGVHLTALLFAAGVAGTIGNVATGGWTDRFGPVRVVTIAMVLGAFDFALMPWTTTTMTSAVIAVVAYGLASWSVMVPQQHRLIAAAPATPSLAVSLNASAAYLAVSRAGALGAAALRVVPGAYPPWLAALFLLAGRAATRAARNETGRPQRTCVGNPGPPPGRSTPNRQTPPLTSPSCPPTPTPAPGRGTRQPGASSGSSP